jgi:tryptophan-rich sensory protein
MIKPVYYSLPPLFYFAVAMAGRVFTRQGVTDWYPGIVKPSFTPPGSIIGITWTVIFILSAISLILFIKQGKGSRAFWPVIGVFVLNGIFNAAWSYIFFTMHLIGPAVIDSLLILITVGLMMALVWPHSRTSAFLLLPYLCWISFATYLMYEIYTLN